MSPKQTLYVFLGGTLLLLVTAYLAAKFGSDATAHFENPNAALAFITASALGIERFIELVWTVIGGLKGTFWPLNVVGEQVAKFIDGLDTELAPFRAKLSTALDKVEVKTEEAKKRIAAAKVEIDDLWKKYDQLKTDIKDTPKTQRAQLLAAAASRNVDYLRAKYGDILPHLEQAQHVANSAINGLQDFLGTFKDNPARRLISLYAGVILGLGIAGLFGLDMFVSILGTEWRNSLADWIQKSNLSLVATGLVIGFGANPTHEVIRAIQEHKERQKGTNASRPNLPTRRT